MLPGKTRWKLHNFHLIICNGNREAENSSALLVFRPFIQSLWTAAALPILIFSILLLGMEWKGSTVKIAQSWQTVVLQKANSNCKGGKSIWEKIHKHLYYICIISVLYYICKTKWRLTWTTIVYSHFDLKPW